MEGTLVVCVGIYRADEGRQVFQEQGVFGAGAVMTLSGEPRLGVREELVITRFSLVMEGQCLPRSRDHWSPLCR